jgi:hypothetical protein
LPYINPILTINILSEHFKVLRLSETSYDFLLFYDIDKIDLLLQCKQKLIEIVCCLYKNTNFTVEKMQFNFSHLIVKNYVEFNNNFVPIYNNIFIKLNEFNDIEKKSVLNFINEVHNMRKMLDFKVINNE